MVQQSKPGWLSKHCFPLIDNCLVDDELKYKFGISAQFKKSPNSICKNFGKEADIELFSWIDNALY